MLVEAGQGILVILSAKNAVELHQRLVARGALNRPGAGQGFLGFKNFFDHNVGVAQAIAQPFEIGGGVVQPVDVVDAHTVKLADFYHLVNQAVGLLKHLGVVDLEADQLVDGKKSAVVEFFRAHLPKRQTVELFSQQLIEQIKAAGLVGGAVKNHQVLVDKFAYLVAVLVNVPEQAFGKLGLVAVLAPGEIDDRIFDQVENAGDFHKGAIAPV